MASLERDKKIVAMRSEGASPSDIARQMGLSKNTVIGVIYRRAPHLVTTQALKLAKPGHAPKGLSRAEIVARREAYAAEKVELVEINADVRAWALIDDGKPIPTLLTRCDALNARMDAVLAATREVGRIKGSAR